MRSLYKLFFLYLLFIPLSFATSVSDQPITVKILGINDFHGQITTGKKINNRPVGGAAVLASYLKEGKPELDKNTLVTFNGDQVGASPPASALLNHESSMLFFNSLANEYCNVLSRFHSKCNLVATIGNHEFDQGQRAMFDIIYGTNKPPIKNWFPAAATYPGASFPYISANIVDAKTGKLLFNPYVIKKINGVKIGFIGAILKDAPDVILPKHVEGIKFLDEADTINRYIPEVKAAGAEAIVVIIHQGGEQASYEGSTREDATEVTGPLVSVVKRLNDDIDVVMGAHYHLFINAYLPNENGKKILVTEAGGYSSAFAEITLSFSSDTHKLLNKSARIITTYADQWPGNVPDQKAAEIVKLAEKAIESDIKAEIGILQNNLLKEGNDVGESNLGNLIADAYRIRSNADFGLLNPGSMRTDIFAGKVTWAHAYSVLPFANMIGIVKLRGQDIYDLLEQQWTPIKTIILQISGFSYLYDLNKPIGSRVVAIYHGKEALQKDKIYSIATNEFFAGGGDGFTVMQRGKFEPIEDEDLQVMIKYIQSLPQPFTSIIDGRIKKI